MIISDDDDNLDDSQLSESTLNLLQEAKLSVEDLAATLLKTEEKTEAIKTAVSKTEVAKFDVSESNANKLEANTEQVTVLIDNIKGNDSIWINIKHFFTE